MTMPRLKIALPNAGIEKRCEANSPAASRPAMLKNQTAGVMMRINWMVRALRAGSSSKPTATSTAMAPWTT